MYIFRYLCINILKYICYTYMCNEKTRQLARQWPHGNLCTRAFDVQSMMDF